MRKESTPYQALCTQYYDLNKPTAPEDALLCYLKYAQEARGPILEPMCGTGRFLIPFLKKGLEVTGFDDSTAMLDVCKKKCYENSLPATLFKANFETFVPQNIFNLIFIPSASFCLLTDPKQISQALRSISNWLRVGGKFVFEIETLRAANTSPGIWKGNWVNLHDGSQIVLSTLSLFDARSSTETTLCRYELWEKNSISLTEVETFLIKLYDPDEMEYLLNQHGFHIIGRWQTETEKKEARADASIIMYECQKRQ